MSVLERAQEIIEERGWVPGAIIEQKAINSTDGPVCLIGALALAEDWKPGFHKHGDFKMYLNTAPAYDWVVNNTPDNERVAIIECVNDVMANYHNNSEEPVKKVYSINQLHVFNDECDNPKPIFEALDCAISKVNSDG